MNSLNGKSKVEFIWQVADLLRGPYKPNQYKDVMLPLTVLRRLDCVLEPTKEAVLGKLKRMEGGKIQDLEPILNKVTGRQFHNTSKFTFEKLRGDSANIAANLTHYIKSFSSKARDVLEHFHFEEQIIKLDKADRLYLVVGKFCEVDLHPDVVPNYEMGQIFEELIRRFNEASNEEAGDHFTPREVIRLMVDLIFDPDDKVLTTPGIIKTLYDPACGTGGMLSVAEEYLNELNPGSNLQVFGQDYNDQAYAICGSDMMIKGHSMENIRFGNSFTEDFMAGKKFDYMLANPPFGVEWKPEEKFIRKEYDEHGYGGRFGAGLPRINDGSFLFLQHMINKMREPKEGGTRLGIVFNGSPLFTGSAGSGESNIRQWIIEHDWLEAIIALPDQLFYNTGISTYIWVLSNRKEKERRGKIQLVDATGYFVKMRKSLGNKRNKIGDIKDGEADQIGEITRLYGDFKESEHVKIFDNDDFGYHRITVERPLRLNFAVTPDRIAKVREITPFINLAVSKKRKDVEAAEDEIDLGKIEQETIINALFAMDVPDLIKNREEFTGLIKQTFKKYDLATSGPLFNAIIVALSQKDETADICKDSKGNPEPDPDLRDYENVPLKEDIHEYMKREVLPHVPDAWVDESKTKTGYEINFNRHFYKYVPPRPLEEIEAELKQIENDIAKMLAEMAQ
jgi:type I restriction enzyme M protein